MWILDFKNLLWSLSLLLPVIQADPPTAYLDAPCTNVSTYSPVVWEESSKQCCFTNIVAPLCTLDKTTLCVDLEETVCQMQTWTECTMKPCPVQVVQPVQTTKLYEPFSCSYVITNVTQVRKIVVPVDKTDRLCDSTWILNDYGQMVWDRYENCQDVTRVAYEWREVNVTTATKESRCTAAPPIKYQMCQNQTWTSAQMCTTCVARAAPRCQVVTRRQCAQVETKECEPRTEEECGWRSLVPEQRFKHKKRCLGETTMRDYEVVAEVVTLRDTMEIFNLTSAEPGLETDGYSQVERLRNAGLVVWE